MCKGVYLLALGMITRGVVEGERVGTELPHSSLCPKILGGKNERSVRFLHLLKVFQIQHYTTA